jgi:hypothetical protein
MVPELSQSTELQQQYLFGVEERLEPHTPLVSVMTLYL